MIPLDCSSFAIMQSLSIRKAFTFDEHFRTAGFETQRGSSLVPALRSREQVVQPFRIEPYQHAIADDDGRGHIGAVNLDQFFQRVAVARNVVLDKVDALG